MEGNNMLTHCGTQPIETKRLILRPFRIEDWKAMQENWVSDNEVQAWYAEPVYETEAEIKGLLQQYISGYEKEDYYRWAMILKDTNECIGQIAYFLVNSESHFGEIEYCVGKAFQNRGFVTEAMWQIVDYGFKRVHFNSVRISHCSTNIPSRRVIEKLGFIKEGALREIIFADDQYMDRVYYSILQREWKLV